MHLCISILEFKFIRCKFTRHNTKNLCISILEFKFANATTVSNSFGEIYVFLY